MKLSIGNNVALHAEPMGRGTIVDHHQAEARPWLVEWDDFASSWHDDLELKILPPARASESNG